ncbi:MAG: Glycogen synthase [candidate division BRC1 bacterium ADurb.BinA364]|nr:MAG: Glycogen synthase [candidate division BRC1 bacterium ADurb.BinA364]
MQRKLGLPADPGMPLVGAISRLADQKGFDLVAKAAASIMAHDVQFVLLGTGAERYHDIFERLAREFPDRAAIRLAFDNTLAHEIEAASDMFLMPSRYEPCGLNQLYSLRYGAVPIARRVGGLADSIVDPEDDPRAATGFLFREYSHLALLEALQRALRLYRDDPAGWDEMRRRGMRQDFSWRASAQEYEKLLLKLKNSPSRIG